MLLATVIFFAYKDNNTSNTEGMTALHKTAVKRGFHKYQSHENFDILFSGISFYAIFILYWQVRLRELSIKETNVITKYSLYLINAAITNYAMPYINK